MRGSRLAVAGLPDLRAASHALTDPSTRRQHPSAPGAISVFSHSKSRSLLRTAQAIRARLLASAMASTL
jgi:hypothetical protein